MRILLIDHDHDLNQQKAIARCYPSTHHQRCWVHKTANILFALPKPVQPKVKAALHEIWMAETRDEAHKALDRALVYKLLEADQGIRSADLRGQQRDVQGWRCTPSLFKQTWPMATRW